CRAEPSDWRAMPARARQSHRLQTKKMTMGCISRPRPLHQVAILIAIVLANDAHSAIAAGAQEKLKRQARLGHHGPGAVARMGELALHVGQQAAADALPTPGRHHRYVEQLDSQQFRTPPALPPTQAKGDKLSECAYIHKGAVVTHSVDHETSKL